MDKVRVGVFLSVFVFVALLEVIRPHRKRALPRWHRWYSNFGIIGLGQLTVRLLLPVTAVSAAFFVQENQWGLFHWLSLPFWINVLLTVLILDFAIYWQHRFFHSIPLLWSLHKMHHQDLDLDVTSGARFHPIEIFLSALIKIGIVALIGANPVAVVIFEVLLNATAMFNHGNFLLPKRFDKWLRKFLVTPEMHKVHHSTDWKELNTNFGFNLPWWDYFFKTYKFLPTETLTKMQLGITSFREPQYSHLHWLLLIPFVKYKEPNPENLSVSTETQT
ncbi:MAG: sterol desaturase family protein [Bdellovibrionales bacterium]|nr:sterol desaturase family protein [Bdellovibrionales bacterium]